MTRRDLRARLAFTEKENDILIAGIDKVNNVGVQLRRENERLREENDKPIKIQVLRICSHCNKEFKAETAPIMSECIGGTARGEITNFMDCPLCGKRNDIWVHVQALRGE